VQEKEETKKKIGRVRSSPLPLNLSRDSDKILKSGEVALEKDRIVVFLFKYAHQPTSYTAHHIN
jgi:hypothetical protein